MTHSSTRTPTFYLVNNQRNGNVTAPWRVTELTYHTAKLHADFGLHYIIALSLTHSANGGKNGREKTGGKLPSAAVFGRYIYSNLGADMDGAASSRDLLTLL